MKINKLSTRLARAANCTHSSGIVLIPYLLHNVIFRQSFGVSQIVHSIHVSQEIWCATCAGGTPVNFATRAFVSSSARLRLVSATLRLLARRPKQKFARRQRRWAFRAQARVYEEGCVCVCVRARKILVVQNTIISFIELFW